MSVNDILALHFKKEEFRMAEKIMIKCFSQTLTAPQWYRQFHVSDYTTLLHIPFSIILMSCVAIGATMAPNLSLNRLALSLIAVFCGLQAAHFLDEVKGHPWNTHISDRKLYTIAFSFLSIGVIIGIYLSITVSLILTPFILAIIFFPIAYSLELWQEKFHNFFWYGISGGFLVSLGSSLLQDQTLTMPALLMAVAIGIHGKYLLILYQGTKSNATREISWTLLKGNVLVLMFTASALLATKLLRLS